MVFYAVQPRGDDFYGGLITLPPVPLRFKDNVFKDPLRRSSSHHKARHSPGVTPDAQPHRPIHQPANDHLLVCVNENQYLFTPKKNTSA